MLAPVNRVPVADLDGQPEPGQRRDAAQTPEPVDQVGVVAVLRHGGDRGIKPVPPLHRQQHRFVGGVERQLPAR